jgi:hypothetical protein
MSLRRQPAPIAIAVTLLALLALLVGCGGGAASGPDFGQRSLASLDEPCQQVPGLTGQAVLDQRTDQVAATLAYVTAAAGMVTPTALTIDLTWPGAPVAVCYPGYTATGVAVGPRVAIEGLSMRFSTADGKFDEVLPARAWLMTSSGVPGATLVVGVESRQTLHGSWRPFSDYDNGGSTLAFVSRLAGASSSQAGGNVGMSATSLAEAGAGIFRSGNAMAIWPAPP